MGAMSGPLAPLLAAGRSALAEALEPGTVSLTAAVRPYALALLAEQAAPLLVVVATERDAEALCDDLGGYLGEA